MDGSRVTSVVRGWRFNPQRRGTAILLVLGVLSIVLGLAYALSRSSTTLSKLSTNELAGLKTDATVEYAPATALIKLAADVNWLPESPIGGLLETGESYQVDLKISREGDGRSLDAIAQSLDRERKYELAERRLSIELAQQALDNHPNSAIAAFATGSNKKAAVYAGSGTIIRGDIRSKGEICFQTGFVLAGATYRMGSIVDQGREAAAYLTYRASWGTSYRAELLKLHYKQTFDSDILLGDVTLGPSVDNPMGVFYHNGDVVIGDNVTITGTIAVDGNVTFLGSDVKLFALQSTTNPETGSIVQSCFPAVVCNKSITFEATADAVRISGLVASRKDVRRFNGTKTRASVYRDELDDRVKRWSRTVPAVDPHDHAIGIDAVPDPFRTTDGPAIYVKGAIMANRVILENEPGMPFALVFDAAKTDTTDAPGFFTWRAVEWTEAD